MKRLSAALLFLLGLASAALAQTFTMPPPAGVALVGCIYNLSPSTLLTATAGYAQCDSLGRLITASPSSGGGFPPAATPITASATGTTAATVATLAAAAAKTTYICGFSITSDATAGLAGNATVVGVITATMTYVQGVGVAPAVASLNQTFSPCIPASAVNTAIVITSAAAGVGGGTAVNAWGYQQ